jgi:hypothetical protein
MAVAIVTDYGMDESLTVTREWVFMLKERRRCCRKDKDGRKGKRTLFKRKRG